MTTNNDYEYRSSNTRLSPPRTSRLPPSLSNLTSEPHTKTGTAKNHTSFFPERYECDLNKHSEQAGGAAMSVSFLFSSSLFWREIPLSFSTTKFSVWFGSAFVFFFFLEGSFLSRGFFFTCISTLFPAFCMSTLYDYDDYDDD